MMIYTELLSTLKDQLNQALDVYQQRYTDRGKRVPRRRALDIADLKALLEDEALDAKALKDAYQERLQHIQTGWWIFRTGRSRLKNEVRRVLKDKAYRKTNLMLALINELKLISDKLAEREGEDSDGLDEAATHEVSATTELESSARVAALEAENRRLAEDKRKLQALVERLRQANHRFTDAYLTRLRQASINGEEASFSDSESTYLSLSDDGAYTEDFSADESEDEKLHVVGSAYAPRRWGFF